MNQYTKKNPLKIGTDCSGIETPIQALNQIGIPYRHMWSSEIDKYCIQSIKANYNSERIYGDKEEEYKDGDIRNRDNSTLPDIDLYVCGFPCQPFSQAGSRKGLEDKRGNVFYSCIDVIKTKQPKYFILENVKAILWHKKKDKDKDKYGETWKIIWGEIEKLKELGYYVDWKLMNTRHYGIPQNRERVYIVGTKKDNYIWPEKCEMGDIKNYICKSDTSKTVLSDKLKLYVSKLPDDTVFIDLAFVGRREYSKTSYLYSGCVVSKGMHWCNPMNRYANTNELLSLQGFDNNFKQVVSKSQMKKQIGNSMSVNVVKKIINNLIM